MNLKEKILKVLYLVKKLSSNKNPNEQDLVLKFFSTLSDKNPKERIMIDVGAHFGISMMKFAKSGWTVYCFEPDDDNRDTLRKNIEKNKFKKVFIDERAVSDLETSGKYYKSKISSGISSLIKFHSSHQVAKEVEITTLSVFCLKNKIDNIDFLKVDTEGNDLKVIEGLDVDLHKPYIILCEYEDSKTKLLNYTKEDMVKYLVAKGYRCIISEWFPIINYGTKHNWKKLTDDISLVDNDSWGNIIAINPEVYYKFIKVINKNFKSKDLQFESLKN